MLYSSVPVIVNEQKDSSTQIKFVEGHAQDLISKCNGEEVEGEKKILFTKMREGHILLYLCGPYALNLI